MPHVVAPSRSPSIHITDDRTRIDVPRILDLYAEAWWAKGRVRSDVVRALEHSRPVVTAWEGDLLVGFTRVISDLTFRATIWDVIVRPSHRGRGIGGDLVRYVLEHPDLESVTQFFLLTADQHRFYERLGFTREREMAMMLRR
ncbi:MAG: GNAT family N-acetyltransferase [Hyphomicrobiales bacterium]